MQLNIPGFDKKTRHFNISSSQKSINNNKKNQFELLLIKEREKNNIIINKTIDAEDNIRESKFHNSNYNNIINNKDIEYKNRMKLKNIDDNTTTRLNINNKGILIKNNALNDEMNFNNYNDINYIKFNPKNKSLINIPKKQSKLVFFEQNKNFCLNNNNIIKEKKLNFKNKNESREIIINKIPSYIKTNNNIKKINNINIFNNKKKVSSVEMKHKKRSPKNKNIENNKNEEFKRYLTNKSNINGNDNDSIKYYINKSTDELRNINYNINIDKVNLNLLKNNNTNNKSEINKNISKIITNINNINNEIKIKSLSNKEKAYLSLSQSKILHLRERIIFSRATKKIRDLISIKDILKSNEIIIKDKIKELEEKIVTYNKIIETHFIPSKTAIISLNLIKKEDENNFKNFLINNNIKEKEKNYYNIYIEILYAILEDDFNVNNIEKIDINSLYNKLNKNGFQSCKDFLYDIFILQHSEKKIYNEIKMDKFSELFGKLPDLIKYKGDIKNNRFISFSYFLLNEIYIYWNKLKEFLNLKRQTQNYIERLKNKVKSN